MNVPNDMNGIVRSIKDWTNGFAGLASKSFNTPNHTYIIERAQRIALVLLSILEIYHS